MLFEAIDMSCKTWLEEKETGDVGCLMAVLSAWLKHQLALGGYEATFAEDGIKSTLTHCK